MIRIKKTKGNCFYLFQGKASANSLFIEDLKEAKQFIILANYYLKGYLKIHNYLLTMDGWNLVVRLNSNKTILSKASNLEDDLSDDLIWRIISERMRILMSTFVRFTNKKQGRTGSKVHSSYERFLFSSLKEANGYLEMMRKGQVRLCQKKKKYRGRKSHYNIPEKLGKGSIFLNSANVSDRKTAIIKRMESIVFIESKEHVLLKWINKSLNSHSIDKNQFFHSQNHQSPP